MCVDTATGRTVDKNKKLSCEKTGYRWASYFCSRPAERPNRPPTGLRLLPDVRHLCRAGFYCTNGGGSEVSCESLSVVNLCEDGGSCEGE